MVKQHSFSQSLQSFTTSSFYSCTLILSVHTQDSLVPPLFFIKSVVSISPSSVSLFFFLFIFFPFFFMSLSATHCSFASFLSHESLPFCTSFLFSFLLSSPSHLSLLSSSLPIFLFPFSFLLLQEITLHVICLFSFTSLPLPLPSSPLLLPISFLCTSPLSPVLCFYFLSIYSSPTPFFHGNQRSFFPSTFNNHSQRHLFSFRDLILHLAFLSLNTFFPFSLC
ncbi:hypothetical protein F5H01DRAFT_48869 [Linnemannia elongata]|nr:hypothetical protein F5H01DRAFT_48869 [Linnemannia elongata]